MIKDVEGDLVEFEDNQIVYVGHIGLNSVHVMLEPDVCVVEFTKEELEAMLELIND